MAKSSKSLVDRVIDLEQQVADLQRQLDALKRRPEPYPFPPMPPLRPMPRPRPEDIEWPDGEPYRPRRPRPNPDGPIGPWVTPPDQPPLRPYFYMGDSKGRSPSGR